MRLNQDLQVAKGNYVSFQLNLLESLIDQILKSPEFISKYSDLSIRQKKRIQDSKRDILKEVLNEEFNEIISKNKISSESGFYDYFDKFDTNKFAKDRKQKILNKVNGIIGA